MTRVDFYLLPDSDQFAKRRFCCRLAHRAVHAGQRVHVRADESAAAELDALMWEYPREHFLPHARCGQEQGEPVIIGMVDAAPDGGAPQGDAPQGDVLINLGEDVAEVHPNFSRVAEIVLASERAPSRAKYRHYRERGFPLFHHELEDWE